MYGYIYLHMCIYLITAGIREVYKNGVKVIDIYVYVYVRMYVYIYIYIYIYIYTYI